MIGVDIERPGHTGLKLDRDSQLLFDCLFQAHGLQFDVVSEETALDGDFHFLNSPFHRELSEPHNSILAERSGIGYSVRYLSDISAAKGTPIATGFISEL